MEFLSILEGISPWWWVAFALAIGVMEMATFTFFLIWPAIAALIVALVLAMSPNLSPEGQISTFAVLAILLTVIGRMVVSRYGDGAEEHELLNKRNARFVGRTAEVLEFSRGEGFVEVDGMRWRAKWSDDISAKKGDMVRITGAEGLLLSVEPMLD